MKYVEKEQGYTLLITVMIIVLFTILGMSLMSLTISGANRSELRESTSQAQDLAMKATDFAVEEIKLKMTTALAGGKNASAFKTALENVLNEYLCSNGMTVLPNTTTGTAEVCILAPYSDISPNNPYKKIVLFNSVGKANGKEETIQSTYEIGADLNLEPFDYVISTFKNKEDSTGGDLAIHGGVEITGNMNVDGNLYISRNSKYKDTVVHSVLPRAYDSQINLSGDSYKKESPNDSKVNSTSIDKLFYNATVPSKKKFDILQSNFGFIPKIDEFKFNESSEGVTIMNVGNLENLGTNIGAWDLKSKANKTVLKFWGETDHDWTLWGKNSFNSVAFPKDLKLKYDPKLLRDVEFSVSNGAYIGADFNIGLGPSDEVGVLDTEVELDGVFYVNDDLHIKSAELTGNAIFYVRDKVNIEFSKINGNFTIFAGGDINMKYVSNNHNDNNKRSIVNGFIHSNKSITIDGATSLMTINGGISAKDIFITSIRGRSEAACAEDYLKLERYKSGSNRNCFEKADNQNKDDLKIKEGIIGLFAETITIKSRVKLQKDPNVKDIYLNTLRINQLDPVIETERKLIN